MICSDAWQDYALLDCSDGERLERWGKYILIRPDPQVIWTGQNGMRFGHVPMRSITVLSKAVEVGRKTSCRSRGMFPTNN